AIIALPATVAIVLFASTAVFTAFIAVLTAWGLYEIVAMMHASFFETMLVAMLGGASAIMVLLSEGGRMSAVAVIVVTILMLALVVRVGREGADQFDCWRWSRSWLI